MMQRTCAQVFPFRPRVILIISLCHEEKSAC